jgi:hypothetical protein
VAHRRGKRLSPVAQGFKKLILERAREYLRPPG